MVRQGRKARRRGTRRPPARIANDGMARKIGERNTNGRNSTAEVTPMRPVRPPSAMPAVLNVPDAMLPVNEKTETSVVSELTTRPEFLRPMMVMKSPMSQDMPYLRLVGMACMMRSRRLVSDRTAKARPSRKMAASATSQVWPMPSTTA